MGRVVYPKSDIYRPTPVFETRSELLEYEAAYHLYADVMNASEASDWKVFFVIYMSLSVTIFTISATITIANIYSFENPCSNLL